MKEMVYSSKDKRELLDTGYCLGFYYYIMNLGTHPTAYVRIPENHRYYGKGYSEIYDDTDIDVHGGLTFAHDYLYIDDNIKLEGWFIGWDYAHCFDYMGYYNSEDGVLYENKKWTTQEIKQDVASVCYQLSKIKRKGVIQWIKKFFKKQ